MTRVVRHSGVRPPQQRRSAAVHQRILDAAESLCVGRDLDDVTVQEICDAAAVSSSSFYARFPTKAVLVRALYDRHVDQANAFVSAALVLVPWDDLSIEDVTRQLLSHYLSYRRVHEEKMRTMMLAQLRDSVLADRRHRHDSELRDLVTQYLSVRLASHDALIVARLPLIVHVMCGAIRAAVELPERFLDTLGVPDEVLVDELTQLFMARVRSMQ